MHTITHAAQHVIPLNIYMYAFRWILWKITNIFKGTTGGQDTMLWTPTHPLKLNNIEIEKHNIKMFAKSNVE